MQEISPNTLDTEQFEMIDSSLSEDNLKTEGIEVSLSSKKIKNTLINDSSTLKIPSYLIDLADVVITEATLKALKGLLDGSGTAVYIKSSTGQVVLVGYGEDYKLYTLLDELIGILYKDKVKIYKNLGKGFKQVSLTDTSSIRLNL